MSRVLRAGTPVLACQDGSGTYHCRRPRRLPGRYDPVNGADGDARQAHRFVGAAARGRTT